VLVDRYDDVAREQFRALSRRDPVEDAVAEAGKHIAAEHDVCRRTQ
jgi:hypothetical protein